MNLYRITYQGNWNHIKVIPFAFVHTIIAWATCLLLSFVVLPACGWVGPQHIKETDAYQHFPNICRRICTRLFVIKKNHKSLKFSLGGFSSVCYVQLSLPVLQCSTGMIIHAHSEIGDKYVVFIIDILFEKKTICSHSLFSTITHTHTISIMLLVETLLESSRRIWSCQ
jgi:hypothetical protein